jgi:DNA-binding NarL/FixJ family response regulator
VSSPEQIPFFGLFGLSIDRIPPNKTSVRVRVLLADDNTLIRQALRTVVENCVRLEVVGEACNGLDAIDAVRRVKPDVVVMDVNMPQMNGIDATKCIKYEFPNIYIIGLSVEEGMGIVEQMQSAGIHSYLTKESAVQHLCRTIVEAVTDKGGRSTLLR